ncbi:AAA domain-containing protein [uncultured Rhodoblastus sp.]|uniref:DEAD/DEAH box helicase n=1 Tax=uncultured Rhodoblastus sp. TaxID=543037 RepID=UPI0025FCCB5D|nr:AAA domain-containing protein [uncultured Rhodoblastus sp.]
MTKDLGALLSGLSRSIDKPVLDDPRLDFRKSPERFPLIGTQMILDEKTTWVWRILTEKQKPARIPVQLRMARLQVAIGTVKWFDQLSQTAKFRHFPLPRQSPLFLADVVIDTITDKDDPDFGKSILRLCEPPDINRSLISWFKNHNIKAEIDPSVPLLKAFRTDDPTIRPVIVQDVHVGIFLNENAQLARTIDPNRNPAILESPTAALLAGVKNIAPTPRAFHSRLISSIKTNPDQEKVVLAALAGENLVLIGPPGCGKTQTIASIVTNCHHQFPKIKIVVASKVEAALDALRRLMGETEYNYTEFVIGKGRVTDPFDILIIDESSRVTTAEIFSFAWQAKQIIIIGDPDQSPPSPSAPKLDKDDTSLIDLALKNPNFSQYRLTYHYRSIHPELLTFSNTLIYDGLLKVVPSPRRNPKDGLCVTFVPTAAVQTTQHSTKNILEAEVLAARLVESSIKSKSLGILRSRMVIGWTYSQARTVETCIKKRLKIMNLTEEILSPVEKEPFVVYTAAEVQGQERDEAWVSFGHGIDPKTKKIAKPRQPTSDMSSGSMKKMNVLMTRSRHATHLYHSVVPNDLLNADPSPEIFTLFALMNTELLVVHSRYEIEPDSTVNSIAQKTFRNDPALTDPEAVNLACVYGVRNKGDEPGNWRYGLFRNRKGWNSDQFSTIRNMLIKKGWKLVNF